MNLVEQLEEKETIKATEAIPTETEINWSKTIGYFLLLPPITSVILFLIQFTGKDPLSEFNRTSWTGTYGYDTGGGYSSALPIYLGLMAIAGAYLIKEAKQTQTKDK